MDITEVRVKLESGEGRLRAFACVTFDYSFVVRDFRIIDGGIGVGLSVFCPSRKLQLGCPSCHAKNHVLAYYCNDCGTRLPRDSVPKELCRTCGGHGCNRCNNKGERTKLFDDVAHPVNREFRRELDSAVLRAYKQELEASKLSGYHSSYFDTEQNLRMCCASGAVHGGTYPSYPSGTVASGTVVWRGY